MNGDDISFYNKVYVCMYDIFFYYIHDIFLLHFQLYQPLLFIHHLQLYQPLLLLLFIRHHLIRHHLIRHHLIHHHLIRHHLIRHHLIRHHLIRHHLFYRFLPNLNLNLILSL